MGMSFREKFSPNQHLRGQYQSNSLSNIHSPWNHHLNSYNSPRNDSFRNSVRPIIPKSQPSLKRQPISSTSRSTSKKNGFCPWKYTPRSEQHSLQSPSRYNQTSSSYSINRESSYYQVKKNSNLGHDQLKLFRHGLTETPIIMNIDEIQAAIDKLSVHQNLTIEDCLHDDKLKHAYHVLQSAAAKFYQTDYYSKLIVQPLMEKDVITINPGTIGQFLFGGIRPNYGDTIMECSPIGIGAMPPHTKEEKSFPVCPRQVWLYHQKDYQLLTNNDRRINQADIYVPLNFNGLTEEEIDRFSRNGVREVTIYSLLPKMDGDILSIKRTKTLPIAEANSKDIRKYVISENENIITRSKLEKALREEFTDELINSLNNLQDGNGPLWIWVVLVIFFIIIVAWIGYSIQKGK